jgi:type IV secretory pathway VirD2 relaxase
VGGQDDLPRFRPKFGRSARARESTSLRNAVLVGLGVRWWRQGRRASARRARTAVPQPGKLSRRVVVKARFVKMTKYGAKAAVLHLRYIERDGVERDGGKGVLYGPEGPARAEAFEEPRPGEKHQFRLIISPEDAAELDLTDYVRRYMAQVEQDVGRRLEWAAVNHYNTEHPHVHVIIRGVDRDGREVRFEREYISNGMRHRAQELATLELGPRTELEMRRARRREIDQERYTSLDRELERRTQDGIVRVRSEPAARARGGVDDATLIARVQHLEDYGLAERVSPDTWRLADGWAARLRELGTRGDIIKQMHQALRGDPTRYQVVAPGQAIEPSLTEPAGTLYGRIAGKGLSDELAGKYYAVIETPSGAGYHVPLDARAAEALRPGDLVAFASRPEGGPSPDLSLQRQRVVVRKDALGLEEQVSHRGPVVLDRLAGQPLAPYGFGAEVERALKRRAERLRSLGIDPADPERVAKLRELERRALGERFGLSSRLTFVPDTPGAFQGRVQLAERGSDGTPYALVTDGTRFVVLTATPDLRARDGHLVALKRDRDGKWHARDLDIDRGRGR